MKIKRIFQNIKKSFLSDWSGMNIWYRILFLVNVSCGLALIASRFIFGQYAGITVYLLVANSVVIIVFFLSILASPFMSAVRDSAREIKREWPKMKIGQKITLLSFLSAVAIFLPALITAKQELMITFIVLLLIGVVFLSADFTKQVIQAIRHYRMTRFYRKLQLDVLLTKIEALENADNNIAAMVELCSIIAPLQDSENLSEIISKLEKRNRWGRFDSKLHALSVLQKHFTNTGRDIHGVNRTKKGEEVTAEKIMLGDVRGLWTKSAKYWLENEAKFRKEDYPRYESKWHAIESYYRGVVSGHVLGIKNQIAVLQAV